MVRRLTRREGHGILVFSSVQEFDQRAAEIFQLVKIQLRVE